MPARGVLQRQIQIAVRTLDDIADAAELVEDDFLAGHTVAVDLQAPQRLPASPPTNRLVFFQPG